MDKRAHSLDTEPPIAMTMPNRPKSPPLAFQMTSNDALVAPEQPTFPSQMPFHAPDYLTNSSASYKSDPLDISSPMEQDLQSQVKKQAEALRLQHQAFVVERECWEMERERLYRRIASLEGLLKSPKGHRSVYSPPDTLPDERRSRLHDQGSPLHSPARSPVISTLVNGNSSHAAPQQQHRSSSASACSRLPSIAEHDASPQDEKRASSINREAAPKHISLPGQAVPVKSIIASFEDELEVKVDMDEELPASPPATRQVLSPPPAEYRKDAGHTPLRIPSRPESSDSATRPSAFLGALEATPTRSNTHRNMSIATDDEDVALSGPLRLPELPSNPGSENFTMDALTARLQYIEEHPDESLPLAMSARFALDSESDVDDSETTVKNDKHEDASLKDTPSLSHGETSAAAVSPPPASETSQSLSDQELEFHDRGGIKLKQKTSMNFGAPFGQLRVK
ncbi:hypothetical protein CAC42_7332 [Sphaceloma murrayae]|uniref:Uncharacterized protein n=1 Tax=Sphaceloma murrayae TaxID=2082308 RepID=A0A2K1QWQ7_9PEZI|nr:hypothetical protein CAC42_7332 [Sphaceloma murrayae]